MKSTIWQESCWTTFYCTTLSHYSNKYHGAFLVSWPRLRITTAVKVQINWAKFTLQRRYKPETSKGTINVTTFILQHYNVTIVSVPWLTHYLIVFCNFTFLSSSHFLFLICIRHNFQDCFICFSCGSNMTKLPLMNNKSSQFYPCTIFQINWTHFFYFYYY